MRLAKVLTAPPVRIGHIVRRLLQVGHVPPLRPVPSPDGGEELSNLPALRVMGVQLR